MARLQFLSTEQTVRLQSLPTTRPFDSTESRLFNLTRPIVRVAPFGRQPADFAYPIDALVEGLRCLLILQN